MQNKKPCKQQKQKLTWKTAQNLTCQRVINPLDFDGTNHSTDQWIKLESIIIHVWIYEKQNENMMSTN